MTRSLLLVLPFALPCVFTAAQSVMPLTGTYRVIGIANDFTCSGPAPAVTAITSGSMTFAANDTFAWSFNERTICVGGAPTISTSAGTTGTYEVGTECLVELDWLSSGRAENEAHMRPDGDVLIGSSTSNWTGAPLSTFVAIRAGASLGNSTLAGIHHIVRIVQDHQATSLVGHLEFGSITFLGNGTWSETGIRSSLPALTTAPYARNGIYQVQPDGKLDFDGVVANGAVAASGEIASWIEAAGTTTAWAVAVRQGSQRSAAELIGTWGFAGHAIESDTPPFDDCQTEMGELVASALTPASAAFTAVSMERDRWQASWGVTHGAVDMVLDPAVPPGRYDLHVGTEWLPDAGAVSANGNYLIHAIRDIDLVLQEGYLLMHVGLRKAPWPLSYGAGTPGTGGLRPFVDGTGGFPLVGNGAFGLLVGDALPAAAGLVALSFGTGATPFAGGMLWVDLSSTTAILLPIGPGGTAILSFALPATSALAGVAFFAQALILDGGAGGGVAMSNGLRVTIGR